MGIPLATVAGRRASGVSRDCLGQQVLSLRVRLVPWGWTARWRGEGRYFVRPGAVEHLTPQRRLKNSACWNKFIGVTREEPCSLAVSGLNQAPAGGPTQFYSDDDSELLSLLLTVLSILDA